MVGVQFNWIFILMAGGLILFFFMSVIGYQKQLSQNKLGTDLASQLELIFSGRGVAPGAKQPIDIAEIPIHFSCTDYEILGQRISGGNVLIFAPAEVHAKKLLTITLSLDLPFRTNNLVMMTGPTNKYYFVNFPDGSLKQKITDTLDFPLAPPGQKLDFQFVNGGGGSYTNEEGQPITFENNVGVKFIFHSPILVGETPEQHAGTFSTVPTGFGAEVVDEKVSAIIVNADRVEDFASGAPMSTPIFFLEKQGGTFNLETAQPASNTFDFASFIAAVFARDGMTYQCIMERALRRTKHVMGVYKHRSATIKNHFEQIQADASEQGLFDDENQACRSLSDRADDALTRLEEKAGALLGEGEASGDENTVENFLNVIKEVQDINEDSVRNSCPTVY